MVYKPITVSLSVNDDEYVRKLAGTKDYTNQSEVIRDALRCHREMRQKSKGGRKPSNKKNDPEQALSPLAEKGGAPC